MTPTPIKELIERAQSPIRHESGGMTNDALSAYHSIQSRFTPETVRLVLLALESCSSSPDMDGKEVLSFDNEAVQKALDALNSRP